MKSIRGFIKGVPYSQNKTRGDTAAPQAWSENIIKQTNDIEKIIGPCMLRITFMLPSNKFPDDLPYGSDLDNLLKRFCDAVSKTILSKAPGKDSCILNIEASKARVTNISDAGAQFEFIILNGT